MFTTINPYKQFNCSIVLSNKYMSTFDESFFVDGHTVYAKPLYGVPHSVMA